ncbi:MAG: PfkB family carbohydrate kinase [Gammaproteobacteria bacterium]
MFDVCVIGPITRDVVRRPGMAPRVQPGGVVYYAGHALRRLGLKVAVVTKATADDADELLHSLRGSGVEVFCRPSARTTVFENAYRGDHLDFREQSVASISDPFTLDDLAGVRARVLYLGPLNESDLDSGFIAAVARQGGCVYLDVQGLLRRVVDGKVEPMAWNASREGLAHVHALKADLAEAQLLSGEQDPEQAARRIAEMGPKEVLVTLASHGSLILANDEIHAIPAYSPSRIIDATGCGDSYFAGYIHSRLQARDIVAAGHCATAVAVLKLGRNGPFTGTEHEVAEMLGRPRI